MIVVSVCWEVRIQRPNDIGRLCPKSISTSKVLLVGNSPEVGAIDAISAIEIPTKTRPIHAARKVQIRPPGPPLPSPKATVDRTVSQVLIIMRAKPNMDTKPKLRCRGNYSNVDLNLH
jgi:hypothetical protein